MLAPGIAVFSVGIAVVLLALMVRLARWLDRREEKIRNDLSAHARKMDRAASEEDHNPGGPLTESQAQRLFEDILQAAIRQKADEILIDRLSGRPQVRLRLEGAYQELTGIGAGDSFRRLLDAARSSAGMPGTEVSQLGGGSFLRLYRKPHLDTAQWRREGGEDVFSFWERPRRNRVVHFALESFPAPGGVALRIAMRPATTAEETRFDLGFAREAEDKFVRAARSRSGIVLLTGPCNSGKTTATSRLLSLLRDEGRRIITVEWPVEWKLRGIEQNDLGDGSDAYDRVGPCLKQAIGARPDVLLLQNIDWVNNEDARAAIDFAAGGGLLITAVHSQGCIWGLKSLLMRHFTGQRQDAASLLLAVVAPRRLSMACGHCAEEYRVPAKIFRQSGMSDPPEDNDGRVATWRGHGCPLCHNTGELGYAVVYEVLDFTGEMKRFIDNRNDWDWDQLKYLERQAWQHGMRTQRELALERVIAGDISLQQALLNTVKPDWLVRAQTQERSRSIY
jgi:type II secretory ATPase GspE/PulE/Tfp pilus assembly ATPase PilB-like protein